MSLDSTSGLKTHTVDSPEDNKVGTATPTPQPIPSQIPVSHAPARALNNCDNDLLVTECWSNLANKCASFDTSDFHPSAAIAQIPQCR